MLVQQARRDMPTAPVSRLTLYVGKVVCEKLGHRMPIICTPEELMGA